MAEILEERIHKLLKGAQIVAVICNQWGDTGKGKFTDLFASEWADVIARGTGGNNAGHTVIINNKENIFHLLPSGVSYDKQGKINILGNGVVIDLKVLCQEMDDLKAQKGSYDNLMISQDAHVIMPYHTIVDQKKDKSQKNGGIGSTGRGIGTCYADKVARRGIMVRDLFDKDKLVEKVNKAVRCYEDEEVKNLGIDDMLESLNPYILRIKPFVRDTINEMHRFVKQGKKILLEGAQGLLLSVEYGTYPFVTSSDCSLNGTAAGVGLSGQAVDLSFGIIKYPFMTRVGGGPFPTELGGRKSEEYCANPGITKESELREYGINYKKIDGRIVYDRRDKKIMDMINAQDSFVRGIGIRLAAGEYGATTGRPRRIGWTDAVSARYAVGINGPLFILTKPDSIAGCNDFSICYGYEHGLVKYTEFNRDCDFLRKISPVLRKYQGYPDIREATGFDELPPSLRTSIEDFEKFTDGRVVIVSNGAERDKTIIRRLS